MQELRFISLNKLKWLLYLLNLALCPMAFAQMPSPQTLFSQLGISDNDIQQINQGDIGLFNVTSLLETELTAGVDHQQ